MQTKESTTHKSAQENESNLLLQESRTTKDLDLSINYVLDQVLTLEQLMIAIIYHFEAVD